ncbi:hypothetical protein V4U86_21735 [Mycobacterium sp. AMU20-3851]|uniref:hypothetical protein n=1 Tax=Mycobacterium sp. AMU20-3851 TaxID=3122055 RepID=UPI0037550206
MTVDFAAPLLGCIAAVFVHHDIVTIRQPRLQTCLIGLLGSSQVPPFGGLPELVHVIDEPAEHVCRSPLAAGSYIKSVMHRRSPLWI